MYVWCLTASIPAFQAGGTSSNLATYSRPSYSGILKNVGKIARTFLSGVSITNIKLH